MMSYLFRIALVFGLVLFVNGSVHAQSNYPNRPVKVVVPFPTGGLADSLTRLYTKELTEKFGQPFVLDYKPGAATNIGASYVAQSPADGYTLLLTTIATNGLNKWAGRPLDFDPYGFAEIGLLGVNTLYVMVPMQSPYKSIADLVRAAKENSAGLSYGSFGSGGPNHLIAEVFRRSAGISKLLHVPYKGTNEAVIDLIAGRIDFMIDGSTINLVASEKLRALAVVYTSRWPTQPNVPTMIELGYPDVTMSTYFGLAAPANTPPVILEKLNDALKIIANSPEVEKRLSALNVMPLKAGRAEAMQFMRRQSDKWGPVLKSLDIPIQ
ncbi:MAG: tripartite tricarboxylate transporter substrate binding protein [Betaproteobacteria bacterium]|nr:tripartite tricarboxylate transporter substrate binding protein [Betaproteobacteria bacterium]NBY06502.1 tripartite tricarboxylate transporter substrate binding protein [Betaproteobacteria bacterium]